MFIISSRYTKAFVSERLEHYYAAEAAILTSQSYRMGSKSLERARLSEIRAGIEYWENKLAALEAGRNPNAPRMTRVVPRDL